MSWTLFRLRRWFDYGNADLRPDNITPERWLAITRFLELNPHPEEYDAN